MNRHLPLTLATLISVAAVPPTAMAAAAAAVSVSAANLNSAQRPMPARLVAAERDGQLLLLLPETHLGVRSEFDGYFKQVIEPAFAASRTLLAERSEDAQLDEGLRYKACSDEDSSEAEVDAAINELLPTILPMTIWGRMPPPAPVTGFGRFMRVALLLEGTYLKKYANATSTVAEHQPKKVPASIAASYAAQLYRDAPRAQRSLDTPATMFAVYCAMSPVERNALATSLSRFRPDEIARNNDMVLTQEKMRAGAARLDTTDRDLLDRNARIIAGQTAPASARTLPAAIERFLLDGRNRSWIAQLPELTEGQRLPFFILGAAHFADSNSGPGMIRLLRDAGYHMSLVENRRQLDGLLARLPPAAAMPPTPPPDVGWKRETWPGTCQTIPGNTICAWGNKRALLQVMGNGPGLNQMTLCTTTPTVWGPRSNCTSVNVPVTK